MVQYNPLGGGLVLLMVKVGGRGEKGKEWSGGGRRGKKNLNKDRE